MRKIAKIFPVLMLLILAFSLTACGGGSRVSGGREWDRAFSNMAEDIDDPNINLTLTVSMSQKSSQGDNKSDFSMKASVIMADKKIKAGDVYYERVDSGRWNVYEKNSKNQYEKSQSATGPAMDIIALAMSQLSDEMYDFELFDYKNGKYVINVDRYLLSIDATYGDFVKGKDKMQMEVTIRDGKLSRLYTYEYDHETNTEVRAEISYKFGGASITLPAISAPPQGQTS